MRNRLINVAIEQFGESGFAGASTRDIAAAAQTTMSNITYHFGGKEGLYRAAAEAIVLNFASATRDLMPAPLADDASRDDRIVMVCSALRTIGSFMLSEQAAPLARFVAREQQDPASVMGEYFQREIRPMADMLEEQVGVLRPDLDDVTRKSTVFYLVNMAIALRSSRLSLCVFMEVTEIEDSLSTRLLDRLEAMAREVLEANP